MGVDMKIKPLFDRVLIKPVCEEYAKSSLVLPETSKARPEYGIVAEIGDGENLDGNKITMKVCVGDKVLFNKYAGADVKISEEDYVIIRQIDIIGVVSDE